MNYNSDLEVLPSKWSESPDFSKGMQGCTGAPILVFFSSTFTYMNSQVLPPECATPRGVSLYVHHSDNGSSFLSGLILACPSVLWYTLLNSQYNILISMRRHQLARHCPLLFILPRISLPSCLIATTRLEIICAPPPS